MIHTAHILAYMAWFIFDGIGFLTMILALMALFVLCTVTSGFIESITNRKF